MARLSSILKGIGKGARAAGRGAMRGVLGFDDRDIIKYKPRAAQQDDELEDEYNPDFSGVNTGPADWMPDRVESDGLIEELEMEAPPEMAMQDGMDPLIGLEMPTLPGRPKRAGRRSGPPAMVDFTKGTRKQMFPADDNDAPTGMGDMSKMEVMPPSRRDGFTPETAPRAGQRPRVPRLDGPEEESWMSYGSGGEGGRSYGPEEMDAAAEGARLGALTGAVAMGGGYLGAPSVMGMGAGGGALAKGVAGLSKGAPKQLAGGSQRGLTGSTNPNLGRMGRPNPIPTSAEPLIPPRPGPGMPQIGPHERIPGMRTRTGAVIRAPRTKYDYYSIID